MTVTIRIHDDTEYAIHELGGTFDSPNDVLHRLIEESGNGHLLEENGDTPAAGTESVSADEEESESDGEGYTV